MQAIFFVAFIAQLWIMCSGLGFIFCSDYHYYLEKKSNRLTALQFGSGEIVNCKDFGNVSTIQAMYIRLPHHCATVVDVDGMNSVMKLCPQIENGQLFTSVMMDSLPKFRYNIFPGTNWCGAGNISSSEDDVGVFYKLDACCRTHDMCNDSIPVGETKYGITNGKLGSISACDCDEKFYECLHKFGRVVSNNVGFMFFNILATPCFKKEYPIKKCLKKGGLLGSQCQEYELDTSKEPIYQSFDSKVYYPNSLSGKVVKNFMEKKPK